MLRGLKEAEGVRKGGENGLGAGFSSFSMRGHPPSTLFLRRTDVIQEEGEFGPTWEKGERMKEVPPYSICKKCIPWLDMGSKS